MPCRIKVYRRKLGLLLVLFLWVGGAISALNAQNVVSARAGLITYVTGLASIDGKRVVLKTARFPQMKDGETISTGGGRVELLLSPGIVLRLAENSRVRMDDTQLSETHVALERGEALVEVVQLAEGNKVLVELGETSTEFARPGLYRLGKAQNETDQNTLRVYGGEALVRSGLKTAHAKRGMAVNLSADLAVSRFDRKHTDLLHAWAARRSFELFMSDPDAREKQTHWQDSGTGYIENRNFGVVYRAFLRRRLPPLARPVIRPAEEH